MQHSFYIAILPVVFLLYYINKQDLEKEPRGILTRVFIFGAISTIPICLVELILGKFFPTDNLPTFGGTFISVFVTVALIEEFGKWVVTYLNVYRRKEFNHAYDGIVYCVFASLGFAAVENILYVFNSDLSTAIMRAVLAVPGHCVDAVIMGYFFSKSKQALFGKDNRKSLFYLLLSVLIPSIVHGIYDGLIFYYISVESDTIVGLFYLYVAISYVIAIVLVRKMAKIIVNFDGSPVTIPQTTKKIVNNVVTNRPQQIVTTTQACVYCGAPVTGDVCTNCGFRKG